MIRESLHSGCYSLHHVLVAHNVGLQLLASGVSLLVDEATLEEIGERYLEAVLLGKLEVLLLQVHLHLPLGGLEGL